VKCLLPIGKPSRTDTVISILSVWKCIIVAAMAISRNGVEHLETRNSYVSPHCSARSPQAVYHWIELDNPGTLVPVL